MEATLMSLCLVHFLAVASPGPDFIIVARNSLKASVRKGLMTAAGITFGNFFHMVFTALAATYLSVQHPEIFSMIKIAGGLYLGWVGWICFKGWIQSASKKSDAQMNEHSEQGDETQNLTDWSAFRMGLVNTLLNAKALIYFISIVTQFIHSDTPLLNQVIYAGTLLCITGGWYSLVSWLTGGSRFRDQILQYQIQIEGCMGFVLMAYSAAILFA